MTEASPSMQVYLDQINKDVEKMYIAAGKAREKGLDPENRVDIPLARNMSERVEGLMSAVAPQLTGSGMTKRIEELEAQHGRLAWQVALKIAEEVAQEKFCKFKDKKEAMEVGIRAGFTYHTLGIVSAPLEGFVELKIKKRKDGKEYFAMSFAGPVRGAGGTAAAVSVLIGDHVRKKFGYSAYDPEDKEISRFITELQDYHERVVRLQYNPSEEETKHLVAHLPVEIDGEPTEELEVSNYKDLSRVDTNRIRGGMCLVLSMIALKGPKLWKELGKWGKEFDLDWGFLEEFLKIQKAKKAGKDSGQKTEGPKPKILPDYTYIADLVAGRPVLTYPLRDGGFRLRLGRCRTSGYSASCIHPATMYVLNKYIATGTQLKMERPGKSTVLSPCDYIEGPIVKLMDGTVVQLSSEIEAKKNIPLIKEIIYLGDILISYGDFLDRAHPLVPLGYCEEWWVQEVEKATVDLFGTLDTTKLSGLVDIKAEDLDKMLKNPEEVVPSAAAAITISTQLKVPLHPKYTFYWKAINMEQFVQLIDWLSEGSIKHEQGVEVNKIVLPLKEVPKRSLELIGAPHVMATEFVVIEKDNSKALLATLAYDSHTGFSKIKEKILNNLDKAPLDIINSISDLKIRDRSGTFIGARMGRPEKAKMRKLTGSPYVLFPVGEEGGRMRSFQAALNVGKVTSDFPIFFCRKCNSETLYRICETCESHTEQRFHCKYCGQKEEKLCRQHGECRTFSKRPIDVKRFYDAALKKLGIKESPHMVKGVKGLSNKDRMPENLVKGILRAKYDVAVNKDGTTRYDMSEMPITHFKAKEIRTSIERLRELGYVQDIKGHNLENDEQILELKPQDIILSSASESLDESADDVLFRIAMFVDELLVKLYGCEPFYNLKSKKDLVGHLVIGLAPHISAGTVGRIIGFSDTQGFFAHPLFHAAMRRDCDGDEACVLMLMDALLNFSRQFLPDQRGGRSMDAPLVLTSKLVPAEVDDMVQKLDVAWRYPLELYEAALEYKDTKEVNVETLGKRLGTEKQYEQFGFTHNTSDINSGIRCSAYKTLPTMEEKLKGQLEIAEKVRAVDAQDVARLVIEKHLLKDTRGNMRTFTMQQFRCVACNEKFRRPPLMGKCTACGGKIIFTVSEGSVTKYLEPSISLAKKYNLSPYMQQNLAITKLRIDSMFGKEKERQEGLGAWFGT